MLPSALYKRMGCVLKIRFVGLGHRDEVRHVLGAIIAEVELIQTGAFGADVFDQSAVVILGSLEAGESLHGIPRYSEGARILDMDSYFESFAALDDAEAFDHM